eukprot:30233-Amorphochlora_amoeboformis.AAC.1
MYSARNSFGNYGTCGKGGEMQARDITASFLPSEHQHCIYQLSTVSRGVMDERLARFRVSIPRGFNRGILLRFTVACDNTE